MLAVAYLDESVSEEKAPGVLTLAGYLYLHHNAIAAHARASRHLKEVGLDFYHQVDCAPGNEQYQGMSRKEREACQRELIANIRANSEFGFCCNINLEHFREVIGDSAYQAYGVAAISCLNTVKFWCKKSGFDGQISYVFEDGYKKSEKADALRALKKMVEIAPDFHKFTRLPLRENRTSLFLARRICWHGLHRRSSQSERTENHLSAGKTSVRFLGPSICARTTTGRS